ncbi:MAG: hypothetical protein U0Y10_25605 [Spirosomataceae bacterium]
MKSFIFSTLFFCFTGIFGYAQTNEIEITDDSTLTNTMAFTSVSDAFEPELWKLFSTQELSDLSFNGISYVSFKLSKSGKVIETTFGKHFPPLLKEKVRYLFTQWNTGFWQELIKEKLLPINKPIYLVIKFIFSEYYTLGSYAGFSDLTNISDKYFFLEPIVLNKYLKREAVTFSQAKKKK